VSDPTDNPMAAAQRHARPALPKRFYEAATVSAHDGLHALALDGRLARTPGRNIVAVPTRPVAEALAAEWAAVDDIIDPAHMPLTRLVNVALDRMAGAATEVRDEIVRYAGSDLVCYRAGEPEELVTRQRKLWDPVLAWAAETLGHRFNLAEGVVAIAQPPALLAAFDAALGDLEPLPLTGLHVVTTVGGSAILALALIRGQLSGEEAWMAACLDEDWQAERWGADEEALARRAARRGEFDAALRLLPDA